jgi:HSP20 family protein
MCKEVKTMNLIKWNPLRERDTFSDRFSRFFDDAFLPSLWLREDKDFHDWAPSVDIYDDEDKIVIKAEIPGVGKDDIHIDVKDRVLTLSGERSNEKEVKEVNFHRKERTFGKFQRSFTLPEGLDSDRIAADYKDGVLNIEIPKPEEKKPKKISVH